MVGTKTRNYLEFDRLTKTKLVTFESLTKSCPIETVQSKWVKLENGDDVLAVCMLLVYIHTVCITHTEKTVNWLADRRVMRSAFR